MSSTEQKNITQHFIDSCFTFGILPTIHSKVFCDYGLTTECAPFENLGETPNLGKRLRRAENPAMEARKILPILDSAPLSTRACPLLLYLSAKSDIYFGNRAVCLLAEDIASSRSDIHFSVTGAIKHATKHTGLILGLLAPGSYSEAGRARRNAQKITSKGEAYRLRLAADVIEYLGHSFNSGSINRKTRHWCSTIRAASGFATRYSKSEAAISDYRKASLESLYEVADPPHAEQNCIFTLRFSRYKLKIYRYGSFTFIRLHRKPDATGFISRPKIHSNKSRFATSDTFASRSKDVTYALSRRDLEDLRFLLVACANTKAYIERRKFDCAPGPTRNTFTTASETIWSSYLNIMRCCGRSFNLRNKLGVYFDVLQWRYLAWKSGNEFFDHSSIMGQKIKSKGLVDLPSQDYVLRRFQQLDTDVAVDLLGIYKASIYPEVDPFKVVADQYKLHHSRFQTDWEPDSPEYERFEQTRAYMWYLGIRVLKKKMGFWPGRIREGAETKPWHTKYKTKGIPGGKWMEAHDVDLTGSVPVSDISNEQYMRQQDSACAPPMQHEYKDFWAMQKAPRRHRRKILYTIQEPQLPDLQESLNKLNAIGSELQDGYVGEVDVDLPFSTDIVTGARCERHKDSPRPFYAASSPWGCVLSYIDGVTRDFLSNVPQSMLGKSTRQKFIDLSSTSEYCVPGTRAFYMSDDKAKYSPRMDPNSQQLPADFFAELFDIPAIKAIGPIMYHNKLFYRVCGHLVSYGSNGTDREGMRGASNTWLEIVAQGLTTRLSRDKGLILGKSIFLSFIDDGLRKFSVSIKDKGDHRIHLDAMEVIQDVIFGLRVLGRELSWDKTFVCTNMFVILNELMIDGSHVSSGLKSFCTAGDLEMKEVMSAGDYEQLYFGKMRGAHSVGTPLDLCHYHYVYETLISHYKMGINLQNNKYLNNMEYRLFCITPISLGGAGIRGMTALGSGEVANSTKEGVGNLVRLGKNVISLSYCTQSIISQEIEPISPIDFMREPEQIHVRSPRIKTQRLPAQVRRSLSSLAGNEVSRHYLAQDVEGMKILNGLGLMLMATSSVSAEEVRQIYAASPVAFIDEFVQKLASSVTLSSLLGKTVIASIRRSVRRDLVNSANYFRVRCKSREFLNALGGDLQLLSMMSVYMT